MHVMARESWTDERLDEFRKRIDERFDRVDERFNEVDARLGKMEERFDKIDSRFESQNRILIFGVIAMSSAYIAGFAALVTQI
jgi:hypothetical protein